MHKKSQLLGRTPGSCFLCAMQIRNCNAFLRGIIDCFLRFSLVSIPLGDHRQRQIHQHLPMCRINAFLVSFIKRNHIIRFFRCSKQALFPRCRPSSILKKLYGKRKNENKPRACLNTAWQKRLRFRSPPSPICSSAATPPPSPRWRAFAVRLASRFLNFSPTRANPPP